MPYEEWCEPDEFFLVIPVYRVVVVSGKENISCCFSREISK